MTFPSSNPSWGPSNQPSQQQPRRGLTPISTAFSSSASSRPGASSSNSPSRATFSPVSSKFPTLGSSSGRNITSRNSSVSSSSSPFSPAQSGSQQLQPNQLLASNRNRTIQSQGGSQLASSGAGLSTASIGGATNTGGGSRLARASPSLSISSGSGLPINASSPSTPSAAGSGVSKIVIAQIFVLLGSLKKDEDKGRWEQQFEQIRRLVSSGGMDVFSKYFRRLLQTNASQIFSGARNADNAAGSYTLLEEEMRKLSQEAQQSNRIAESLDTNEGDLFRDFDLSTFMEHFNLKPIAKVSLALACKSVSKSDLRTKADAILSTSYQPFLYQVAQSGRDGPDGMEDSFLAAIIGRLVLDPPRNWSEENHKQLMEVVSYRYARLMQPVPVEVRTATEQLVELASPHNSLVQLIHRTGPRGTSSLEACKDMLQSAETRSIDYLQIANALLFMVIVDDGQTYNAKNFVAAVREHRAGRSIDWQDVLHAFDRERFEIAKKQFLALFEALVPLSELYENVDIQALWGFTWQNVDTQLSFVSAFLSHNADELDASTIPKLRKAFTLEMFDDAPEEVKAYAAKACRHPMVSYEAVAALFSKIFQSHDAYSRAQTVGIPEHIINPNTDMFVVSAAAVPKPWGILQEQALKQLLAPYLSKTLPNYSFVLHGLWKQDKTWLIQRFTDDFLANTNSLRINVILEHLQEHGWLDEVIALNNELSMELAGVAHSRALFEIEPWANRNFQTFPDLFVRVLLNFLDEKIRSEELVQREGQQAYTAPIGPRTVYFMLSFLEGKISDDELVKLERKCIRIYPRLINYGNGFDAILDQNSENGNGIGSEADAKMQEHYKSMYSGECEVRDIVQALQRYKGSENPADQELFACMIHGLFDEYSCYQEYPLEALATTAVLFGSIINYDLLSRIALQAGLAMVLEAVREHTPDVNMYKFGLQALLNFKSRLEEWPTFCEQLLRVPHLQGTEIWTIAADIVRLQQGDANGFSDSGIVDMPNGTVDEILAVDPGQPDFTCVHADPPLRPELYEDPDEAVQDKVLFVLNNVSERNLEVKLRDLRDALREEHHQWFAKYLVEERAKHQPNFQQLYLDMLRQFENNTLWQEVLRETYVSIVACINSPGVTDGKNSADRNYLKNLAIWLGNLTLARDKPIKFRNISFKDLLLEGYESNRLIVVVPFTCRVLEQAKNSVIFKPPNPWIMEIIGVLAELYHHAEMKMNQKFEIEFSCDKLGIDIRTMEAPVFIRSRPTMDDEYYSAVLQDNMDNFAADLNVVGLNRSRVTNDRISAAAITAALPDLSDILTFNFPRDVANPARMRSILIEATKSALTEIIGPVVERSVTIAAISTSNLVTKDFATEPDEGKLTDSAHNVVKALSGSLALVTCKEPLRNAIQNNIRLAAANSFPEQMIADGYILMFINDNLDNICQLVEQQAEFHSIDLIDSQLEEGVNARRQWANNPRADQFVHPTVSRWAFFIPEPFKQTGPLNREQLAIYEEFGRQIRTPHAPGMLPDNGRQLPDVLAEQFNNVPALPTPAEAPGLTRLPQQQQQRIQGAPAVQPPEPQPQMNGYLGGQNFDNRLSGLLSDLQRAAREAPETHIKDLPPTSPILDVFGQLLHLVDSVPPPQRDNLTFHVASKVTNSLFEAVESRLEIELLVQLLSDLCQMSPRTAHQAILWFMNLEDEKFFQPTITACLLKAHLVDVHRIDEAVAKGLETRDEAILEFFDAMVEELLVSDDSEFLRVDFANSFQELSRWLAQDTHLEKGSDIVTKLQGSSSPAAVDTMLVPHTNTQDQMEYVFEEWTNLVRPETSETSYLAFVRQLELHQVVAGKDSTALFIRSCVEVCVTAYEVEAVFHGSLDKAYLRVDALAKLLVYLVAYQGQEDGSAKDSKATYFDGLLSIIVLVLCHHHQVRQEQFNQKVFFRLFSGTVNELHEPKLGMQDHLDSLILVMGRAFLTLQPKYFPSFAFGWLSLVAHRNFMPAILRASSDDEASNLYRDLTEAALAFAGELIKPVKPSVQALDFYFGVLRYLLVLHHDFPEFLVEHHYRLCGAIPIHCTQLRNLVVSAYPSSFVELPDPSSPTLKVNKLEEIRDQPPLRDDIESVLEEAGILDVLTGLLQASTIKAADAQKIINAVNESSKGETGQNFTPIGVDTALLHAVVLFIGNEATRFFRTTRTPEFSPTSPPFKLIDHLVHEFQPEARYHFISAIVNQLRYPNSHTYYFSAALLHLFGQSQQSGDAANQQMLEVQQQITRVLMERLLVHRPHPWGLIITLLELLKNPNYAFWDLQFIKNTPEVSRILLNLMSTPIRSQEGN